MRQRPGQTRQQPLRGILSALGAFLLAGEVVAADSGALHFERIGSAGGPPPSVITALHQDRNGLLWIASRNGLFLFDGYVYTAFQHDPSNPGSLTSSDVRTIYEEPDGTIWVGTNTGGLNRFDPVTRSFEHFRHDGTDPRSLSHDSVYAIQRDRKGRLWVGTQIGLNRAEPGSREFSRILVGGPEGLPSNYILTLFEDRKGRLWAGTIGAGLLRWDDERGTFEVFRPDPKNPRSLADVQVNAIHEDAAGRLWIGTTEGLSRMDPDDGTFVNYPAAPGRPDGLPDALVTSFADGPDGSLWVATFRGGLAELDPSSGRFRSWRHEPERPDSLSTDSIMSLLLDRDGSLWIATWGGGLNRVSRAGRLFHPRQEGGFPRFGAAGRDVTAIRRDSRGSIWIGTRAGHVVRLAPDRGDQETVLRGGSEGTTGIVVDILEDRSGRIWIASSSGLRRLDPGSGEVRLWKHDPRDPAGLGPGFVTALLQDRGGQLWVGTGEGGLHHLDANGTVLRRFVTDPRDPSSLSDDYVTVLLEDRRGRLWVGTRSGGLNELDPTTGRVRRLVPRPQDPASLGHHHVTSLLEDSEGRLWAGTAGGGLNRIERSADDGLRVERVTEQDGLIDDQVTGIVEDDDRTLWVSTRRGLSRFDPRSRAFMNLFVSDGLPSAEFELHAAGRSPNWLYFGTVGGLVVIRAATPFEAPRPSPISVRSVRTASGEILGPRAAEAPGRVEIPYGSWLSIELAVLDFVPEREHRYAYRLEDDWIDIGDRREITFTSLAPGTHSLRIRGRNSQGVWAETDAPLPITVVPPFWMTVQFRLLVVVAVAALAFGAHRRRTSVLERRNRELVELQEQREKARQELDDAFQRLRGLTRRLEVAKEDERQRIARELHDEMGPSLTAVIINLRLLPTQRGTGQLERRIDDTVALVDSMIQRIRDISLDLRPPLIDELGLVPALGGYLESVSERTGLEINLRGDKNLGALPAHVPITAFRLVQESVTNVVRHASAGRVEILVRRNGSGLELSVEDDGRGFDVAETMKRAASGKAIGLLGMQERVDMLDGEIEIDSTPGEGTRIHVRLPISEAA